MVETVTIQEEVQEPQKNETENVVSRPEGLPEKFKSVEELVKSYGELEKKMSSTPTETTEPKTESTTNNEKSLEITANKAVESAGLDMVSLQQEYTDNGQLNEESYQKLEKAGIGKDIVDQYIAGTKALSEQHTAQMKGHAGGEEAYEEMTKWAADALTPAEKDAYNQAVNSKNMETMKLAITGLKARFTQENGSEPTLLKGKASPSAEKGYQSWAQVTQAMSDPRYQTDPAYQDEVQVKLSNSNL